MSADELIFPNFHIFVLYFLANFEMYKRFSDRCHFIYNSKFSCLKKANLAVSKFFVFNYLKISVFDKS